MREIKFRVWDKENSRIIYTKPLDTVRPMIDFIGNLGVLDIGDNCDWKGIVPRANYELMQYTGLKDKNGKEIYEGDIVKYPDCSKSGANYDYDEYDNIGFVEYDIYTMSYYFTNRESVEMDDISIDEDVEVIGNIYENPTMLEE